MSKEVEARKALLASQLEHAVVEHIGTEENDYPSWDVGTYRVFIPGAVREENIVKAADEAEAKAKVLACLTKKLEVVAAVAGDDVEVSPDNIKQTFKTKITLKEEN